MSANAQAERIEGRTIERSQKKISSMNIATIVAWKPVRLSEYSTLLFANAVAGMNFVRKQTRTTHINGKNMVQIIKFM